MNSEPHPVPPRKPISATIHEPGPESRCILEAIIDRQYEDAVTPDVPYLDGRGKPINPPKTWMPNAKKIHGPRKLPVQGDSRYLTPIEALVALAIVLLMLVVVRGCMAEMGAHAKQLESTSIDVHDRLTGVTNP
jgi:hypothetical protein